MKKAIKRIMSAWLVVLMIFTVIPFAGLQLKASAVSNNWAWPCDNHQINADWGYYPSGSPHSGIDYNASLNSNVYSTCDGIVNVTKSLTNSYGNHIIIQAKVNNETVYMYYCHLNSIGVSEGQKVSAGQVIGKSGSTGNSTGPHLHYEVRNSSKYYNTGNVSGHGTLNPHNYLPGTSFTYETNTQTVDIPEGVYTIHNVRDMNKVIDIKYNSTERGAPLILFENELSKIQKFRVVKNGSYYSIQSVYSGHWLDISRPESGKNGCAIQQWNENTNPEEKWEFIDAGNGNVYIHSPYFNVNVDSGGPTDDRKELVTWVHDGTTSQQWKFVRVSESDRVEIEEGIYEIHNVRNLNQVMDIRSDSMEDFAIMQLYEDLSNKVQKFRIVKLGQYYGIQSLHSSRWLDISHPVVGERDLTIQLYGSNSNKEEKWIFEDAGNGNVLIRSLYDVYVDTDNGYTANSTPLETFNYDASTSQQWKLVKTTEFPTATLEADETCCDNQTNVYFTFGGNNSGVYTLGLYKDGNRIDTVTVEGNSYHRIFSEPGNYSAYMTAFSAPDYTDSNWVYWKVYDKTTAEISIDKNNTIVGRNVNFSFGGDNCGRYTIGINKDGERIKTETIDSNSYSFTPTEVGNYSAYITAYSKHISIADSEYVYWTVNEIPTKPIIKSITPNPDGSVDLEWTPCSVNTLNYSVRFYEKGSEEEFLLLNRVTDQSSYSYYGLPSGEYSVMITAEGLGGWTHSEKSALFKIEKTVGYLIFDTNGSTSSIPRKQISLNTPYGNLPNPTRVGYIFKGWFTSANEGTEVTSETIVTSLDDHTLYAHWEHDTFIERTSGSISVENKLIFGDDILNLTAEGLSSQFGNSNTIVNMKSQRMSTGTTISLVDDRNEVYDTITVVVFGDVNGDSWYDGMDAVTVSCIVNGLLTKDQIGEAAYMAADCNHDGVIDEFDVAILNQAGVLLANVDQTKTHEELAADSDYIEYLSLIDQTVETDTEQKSEQTQESDKTYESIFEMIIDFIKSVFEMLISLFQK